MHAAPHVCISKREDNESAKWCLYVFVYAYNSNSSINRQI